MKQPRSVLPERKRMAHLRTGVRRAPTRNDLMLAAGALGWASTQADPETIYSVALEIMAARDAGRRMAKSRKKPRPIAFECKRYVASEWRPEMAPKRKACKGERGGK